MLVLDDYRAHKTDEIINYMNESGIRPFLILGGFTYYLQPLDVTINKPFKDSLR